MISLPLENVVKYTIWPDCNQLIHVGKLGIIYSHHIYKENFMKGMKRKLKAIYKTLHAHLRLIFALIYNFYTFTSFLVAFLQRCNIFFFLLFCVFFFFFFSGSVGIVRRNCCGELFIGFCYWSSGSGISHFGMLQAN